jgi:periplasmic divalent cation tolerance protein
MDEKILIVATNAPDRLVAEKIAHTLVAERLAACVNMLAPCDSVYRWQGVVETATEIPLLIKTTQSAYEALAVRLRELHPYETPELVAWLADRVSFDYANWVIDSTEA